MHASQHESDMVAGLGLPDTDTCRQFELPVPELNNNNYFIHASANVITPSSFSGDGSVQYPMMQGHKPNNPRFTQGPQESGLPVVRQESVLPRVLLSHDLHYGSHSSLHHEAENSVLHQSRSYDFLNTPVTLPARNAEQQSHMLYSGLRTRPDSSGVHMPVSQETRGALAGHGFDHYINNTFDNEQDRSVQNEYGSPSNSLPLDFTEFDRTFNLGIEGPSSLDDSDFDCFLNEEIMYCCGA